MKEQSNVNIKQAVADAVRVVSIASPDNPKIMVAVVKVAVETYADQNNLPLLVVLQQLREETEELFVQELARRVRPKGRYFLRESDRQGKPVSTWGDVASELGLPKSTVYTRWASRVQSTSGWPRLL